MIDPTTHFRCKVCEKDMLHEDCSEKKDVCIDCYEPDDSDDPVFCDDSKQL